MYPEHFHSEILTLLILCKISGNRLERYPTQTFLLEEPDITPQISSKGALIRAKRFRQLQGIQAKLRNF